MLQPKTLRDEKEANVLKALEPDVMVVAAYGLILPQSILQIPRLGCINIHASLLPRWRGAAPIQRAILAGDMETGITIMQMEEGLDTGPMIHQIKCPIDKNDTSETLHDRLAQLGAKALLEVIDGSGENYCFPLTPQDSTQATYAQKISKEEAQINWTESAEQIDRQIRAFNPKPVAWTTIGSEVLRIWQAEIISYQRLMHTPGTIHAVHFNGIDIVTGEGGLIRLLRIQLSGGRILSTKDVLNTDKYLSLFKANSVLN